MAIKKIQFSYFDTGDVEDLEYHEINGETVYTATIPSGGQFSIEKGGDKVFAGDEIVAEINKMETEADNLKAPRGWKALPGYKVSSDIYNWNISILMGTIGTILSVPIGYAFVYNMACVAAGALLKTVYFTIQQYYSTTVTELAKNSYTMYKHSNYTTVLSSGSYEFHYTQS